MKSLFFVCLLRLWCCLLFFCLWFYSLNGCRNQFAKSAVRHRFYTVILTHCCIVKQTLWQISFKFCRPITQQQSSWVAELLPKQQCGGITKKCILLHYEMQSIKKYKIKTTTLQFYWFFNFGTWNIHALQYVR